MLGAISTADPVSPGTQQFGPLQRLGRFYKEQAAQGNGQAVGAAFAQSVESQLGQAGDHVSLSQAVAGINHVLQQTASGLGVPAPQLVNPTTPGAIGSDLQALGQTLTNLTAQGKTVTALKAFDANAVADAATRGLTLKPGVMNSIVNQTISDVQLAAPTPLNVVG
ncbi:MAG: hypothetical protein POG24_08985 [Acidocella sp.]|nr:hypothetical protein [Acidocella sp.]